MEEGGRVEPGKGDIVADSLPRRGIQVSEISGVGSIATGHLCQSVLNAALIYISPEPVRLPLFPNYRKPPWCPWPTPTTSTLLTTRPRRTGAIHRTPSSTSPASHRDPPSPSSATITRHIHKAASPPYRIGRRNSQPFPPRSIIIHPTIPCLLSIPTPLSLLQWPSRPNTTSHHLPHHPHPHPYLLSRSTTIQEKARLKRPSAFDISDMLAGCVIRASIAQAL